MLQIRIITATFVAFVLIGVRHAQETEKTVGELMLSSLPDDFAELRNAFFIEDYEITVQFYFYKQSSKSTAKQLKLGDKLKLNELGFEPTKKTLVVIHGYQNNIDSPSVQDIKNGALEFHDVNVIAVDWNYFTRNGNYAWVASMVGEVGAYVGKFVEVLIAKGLKKEDVHLIGHSLGAHVAGFAGKHLKSNGNSVARITGLDPAFPGFYNTLDYKGRLNYDDAEFVDCIHTCGGKLGYPTPICQADFFPNGGLDVQPGCTLLDFGSCSHTRSHDYFAESLNPGHLFNAKTCNGIAVWVPYDCHDEGALMGYPASPKFKGPLTLTTNKEYPFAKHITTV